MKNSSTNPTHILNLENHKNPGNPDSNKISKMAKWIFGYLPLF